MKEIKAIIQPGRLTKVRDAFRELGGFPGMTVSKVQGCSEHDGLERHENIVDELNDFSGKIRIELIASEELVPQIVAIIHRHTHTGQKGDGILWVTEVVDFHRLCKPLG